MTPLPSFIFRPGRSRAARACTGQSTQYCLSIQLVPRRARRNASRRKYSLPPRLLLAASLSVLHAPAGWAAFGDTMMDAFISYAQQFDYFWGKTRAPLVDHYHALAFDYSFQQQPAKRSGHPRRLPG